MFQASTTSLRYFHVLARIFLVLGLFFLDFNISYLMGSIIFYHIFMTIGLSVMLHRFFSHKSFIFKSKIIEYIFTLISILSMRGSPVAWAYIHRYHHEYVDSEKDPHSPYNKDFNLFSLLDGNRKAEKIEIWKIRSMINKEQLFINKYYWLIVSLAVLPMAIINFEILFYFWLIPIIGVQFGINLQNYLGHTPGYFGYKNFENKKAGHSQNNIFLWPLYLGEAWHNNHHAHSGHFHYGKEISGRWWEYDPAGRLISILKK